MHQQCDWSAPFVSRWYHLPVPAHTSWRSALTRSRTRSCARVSSAMHACAARSGSAMTAMASAAAAKPAPRPAAADSTPTAPADLTIPYSDLTFARQLRAARLRWAAAPLSWCHHMPHMHDAGRQAPAGGFSPSSLSTMPAGVRYDNASRHLPGDDSLDVQLRGPRCMRDTNP